MKLKSNLRTVRLTGEENQALDSFIASHPNLNHFSSLVRVALREYIRKNRSLAAGPPSPSFLWEYKLNEEEIFEILQGPQKERLWLVAKILEHAKWAEVWHYLSPEIIEHDLPHLRLSAKTKKHWEYAFKRWRKTDENSDPSSA
ncbi:MAG: hypothetical protein Q8P84_05160 [Deltaproteobacteria bacterium]|nr:hypothetical protein [Deltaproteobacteria bacterium]